MADLILTAGPAPHIRSGVNTVHKHYATVIGLLPAVIAAIYLHGIKAILIILLSVATFVAVEAFSQYLMKQPIYALDGHAVIMGIVFALLMPPSAPWWLVFFAVALSAFLGKQIFGGLGCYPFHPALIGYLMVLLSWPHYISPVGGVLLGTACPYAVALGGIIILAFGFINRLTPIAFLVGVIGSAAIFSGIYPETFGSVGDLFLKSNVVLAAFFLITDDSSSPANCIPKILFGIFAGVMVSVIKAYGIWMEVVPFAILLANMAAPLLDRIKPKPISMEKTNA